MGYAAVAAPVYGLARPAYTGAYTTGYGYGKRSADAEAEAYGTYGYSGLAGLGYGYGGAYATGLRSYAAVAAPVYGLARPAYTGAYTTGYGYGKRSADAEA